MVWIMELHNNESEEGGNCSIKDMSSTPTDSWIRTRGWWLEA